MTQEGDDTRCDACGIFLDQLASICFIEDATTNKTLNTCLRFILISDLAARCLKLLYTKYETEKRDVMVHCSCNFFKHRIN